MAGCPDIEQLLACYVDGESPESECAHVEAHLRVCPACRERVATERNVREALVSRREHLRATAPATLRSRCHAARPVPAAVAVPRANETVRRTWIPLSMVATFALAIVGALLYGLQDGTGALAAQLAVDHVKCFEFAPNPTIIPSAATLGRQWSTDRGWSIKVPESAPVEQLELLGMRRCISTQGTTAHLMYRWHGQPLSLYVMNGEEKRIGPVPQIVERLGQEAFIWSKGGRTYAVVTRGRPSEIEHVAQYVRAAAE